MALQPRIGIDLDFYPPLPHVAAGMLGFAEGIKTFHEPLNKSVREVMIPSINENFDAEGRPPWQALADGTVDQRGEAHPILQRTGKLRRAATALARWAITGEEAVYLGDSGPIAYGAIHQFGGGYIPSRPYVSMQPQDEDRIVDIFQEWLGERASRLGGF